MARRCSRLRLPGTGARRSGPFVASRSSRTLSACLRETSSLRPSAEAVQRHTARIAFLGERTEGVAHELVGLAVPLPRHPADAVIERVEEGTRLLVEWDEVCLFDLGVAVDVVDHDLGV